jgi:hypothetical protein
MNTIKPNFFIVGAQKAGTSTIADALNRHPDVYMSPIKEPCFFAKDIVATPWARWYSERIYNAESYSGPRSSKSSLGTLAFVSNPDTYYSLFSAWTGESAIGEDGAQESPQQAHLTSSLTTVFDYIANAMRISLLA